MIDLNGLTILIVDDEEMLREVIADSFKRMGCKVFEADGANSACEIIAHGQIDVVISDVRMPNGDGIQLLQWIAKLKGIHPLVIMISGFSDLTEVKAKEMGAVGLFHKPFHIKELIEEIKLHWKDRARAS